MEPDRAFRKTAAREMVVIGLGARQSVYWSVACSKRERERLH
jgi:hypothetical protein